MHSSIIESPIVAMAAQGTVARPKWDCDFIINGRFLSQPVTGVQRYAREITAALDALLVSSNGSGHIVAPRNAVISNAYDSIRVSRLGAARGHFWEQMELPVWADRPILSLCNVGPVCAPEQVVCIHDANVFLQPNSYSLAFRSAYKALLPQLAKRAAVVTTVSEASRQAIARYLPVKAEKIVVIPNGHEHCFRWSAIRSSLAQRITLRRPFVFMLGSRARHKNLGVIIRLAETLNVQGIDLVIAGGTFGIYSSTSNLDTSHIRWLGTVTDDDLAFLYSHAMCLAFPSLAEGFGLPIVEAMALGCPVVTSERGSMMEVSKGAALLAAPDEPHAWLAHFRALRESASLRQELRDRGLERVKRYSWSNAATAYLSLYGHRE